MSKVVTFGEIMTRFRMPGFKRIPQSFPGVVEVSFAGSEANVAASISLFGGSASFITVLPDNSLGDACMAYLRSVGIDTSKIIRIPDGRIGSYYIETGANQRASTVIYDREHSAIADFPSDKYNWESLLTGAEWFHTTGITPALSEYTAKAAIDAVQKAKELGITVSCDLNFRGKLWKWGKDIQGRRLARETMKRLLPFVDFLIGNESDAEDVLGICAGDSKVEEGRLEIAKYQDVAEKIIGSYPNIKTIAITLRESLSASHNRWGAMLYDALSGRAHFAPTDRYGTYQPYEIKSIVDRVGAGDSFGGALIFALMDLDLNKDVQSSLSWAVAAGALCHSIEGDFNFITRKEVDTLASGNSGGRVQR